jgi:hypothetical protein
MLVIARAICRYLFRFVLFYWICFIFPFPLDLVGLPFQLIDAKGQPAWMQAAREYFTTSYSWVTTKQTDVCKWAGDNVLHVEVVIQPTGSGDTMRAYVGCLCAIVVAAGAAAIWSMLVPLVNRWKPDWPADAFLHGFVRVLVRFFLMQMLFGYGFAKLFPIQFSEPSAFRLNQQLGDMSPMGLLWTFMGFSTHYQMFCGAIEVLAGLLLITRRTTLLGALVTIAAMTQVFVLNMCFDVPVKLYSFNYVLMAIFLAAPDLPRLMKALILGMAVEARPFTPLLGNVLVDRLALALRTLLVGIILYVQMHAMYKMWNDAYGGPPIPVRGGWEVVSMQIDKEEPEKSGNTPWHWLDFTRSSMLRVSGFKPPNSIYRIAWNAEDKTFTLTKFTSPAWSATFTYDLPEPDRLELQGSMDGKAITATLKPAPEKPLMSRGFHWIQELPYNR